MTAFDPFAYPAAARTRPHAPRGYLDYRSYKPWLRDEFAFRCAYCLTREQWDQSPTGHASFGIDHVVPQAQAPDLADRYDNLLYACNYCNSTRGAAPLPFDPATAAVAAHLRIAESGLAVPLSPEGLVLIDLVRLNSPGRVARRLLTLRLAAAKLADPGHPEIDSLFRTAFAYPADLPDLARLRPPAGNADPAGVARSHFARRGRGELAATY